MTVINRPSLLSCCITLIHSQIESVTLSRQDRAVDVFHNKCLRRILPIQRQDHVSLRPRCNLTLVSNVCETGSITLFWTPFGLNELSKMRLESPFNLIGKSTMAFLTGQSWRVFKSWYIGGGLKQGFRRCFADELNQSLVSSACGAG